MLYHIDARTFRGGPFWLTAFFVVSGFLITRLLLQEWDAAGSVSFRDFYMRRALRLFPALLTLLAVMLVYALTQPPGSETRNLAEIAASLAYVGNFAVAFGWVTFRYLGHTWSLAAEEQFYLLWPLALVFMLRRRFRPWSLAAVALGVTAVSTALRSFLYRTDADFERVTFAPDTRAGEMMMGCVVAIALHYGLIPRHDVARRVIRLAVWVGIPVSLLLARESGKNLLTYRVIFTVITVVVALIIVDMQLSPGSWRERALGFRPLVWIGRLSYGLYLWHFPVYALVDENMSGRRIERLGVKFAITFLIATVSFYAIERRFLRLKVRYSRHKATEPSAASAPAG